MLLLRRPGHRLPITMLLLSVLIAGSIPAFAQDQASEAPANESTENAVSDVPDKVDVEPVAEDVDIAARLTRIMEATNWFVHPDVEVDEGVVFLSGDVDTQPHKEWAGRLAGNTQDVVAVVNRIKVIEPSIWDLSPAWDALEELGADAVRSGPLFAIGLVVLFLTWLCSGWARRLAASIMKNRVQSPLLRDVAARAIALPVFLVGVYLVLKISGLTSLAMTVLGGTGLIGLVVGFAFRDIAENFLASILLSVQRPFASGDFIHVAEFQGYVQGVTTRSTLLMTIEGNHVQIPNATIYKESITNFTANPNTRFDFVVGVGYDASTADAQSIVIDVLKEHKAVVQDPEPLVLIDALGSSTVNLRVYFWVNTGNYSGLKVKSAVTRLTKNALEQAGISMPDDAREVVFPDGVPVQMLPEKSQAELAQEATSPTTPSDEPEAFDAEGDLASESEDIQRQAQNSRTPEEGKNLLDD